MKILHINTNYAGTPLHRNMVAALARVGVKSLVFVPTCKEIETPQEDDFEVRISRCFKYWDAISFLYKQSEILKAIESSVCVSDFDLIHAYTVSTDGNVAYNLHKKYGIKYIVAVRNTDINYFFKKRKHLHGLGLQILRNAEKVCFLSEAYKKTLIEKYVPDKYKQEILDKAVIIPNGIDSFWLEHLLTDSSNEERKNRIKQKKLRVVFAGRIEKPKNCGLTVDALKLLEGKGWIIEYHVAGKIANEEEYEYLKNYRGFVYHGLLNKEQMIELYRDCDLYVMPSHTETFGLTYAEAMTQGLPVIYTRGQGFDGQFPDGEVGYPTCDSDAHELAERIERCIEHYDEISERITTCAQRFDWNKIAPQYVQLYEDIVK